jgi:two-component system NarL family response regulator
LGRNLESVENPESKRSWITVLAVDHNPILLKGIAVLIGGQPDMKLVGTARNSSDAFALHLRMLPDVTVIDLELPDSSACVTIRRILAAATGSKLIGLTTWDVDNNVSDALAAGACAVVAKDRLADDLPAAIRSRASHRETGE